MEQGVRAHLEWPDYIILVLAMGISVIVHVLYRVGGGKQRTTRDYYTADNSMTIFTVSVALSVSFISAITLLGLSAENYTYGTQFAVINVAYVLGTCFIHHGYMPVFFNVGAVSVYEYLEKRFGYYARLTASLASWLQLLLYCGLVLYAPALALETSTGLSRNWSIMSIGVVCSLYTTISGIKALLVTDIFQAVLMYSSLIIVIVGAAQRIGGFAVILQIASEGARLQFNNLSPDPTVRHSVLGLVIGGLFIYLSVFGVNQVQVQRTMTLRSLENARLALWISLLFSCGFSLLTCFSGLAIYSYYYNCDPSASDKIATRDMLMPQYVMDSMSHLPGVPGLFIAGIFSAALTTISAGLNSLAVLSLEDYVKPAYTSFTGARLTESKSLAIGKLLVLFTAIACIMIAFVAKFYMGAGILEASLTIFGAIGGPLLGIFSLGMLLESATEIGAVIGLLTSMAFTLWIAFGQPKPIQTALPVSTERCDARVFFQVVNTTVATIQADEPSYFYLYRISYVWYGAIGFTITIAIGYVVSQLSRLVCKGNVNPRELDPDLFFPFVARIIRRRRTRHAKILNNPARRIR